MSQLNIRPLGRRAFGFVIALMLIAACGDHRSTNSDCPPSELPRLVQEIDLRLPHGPILIEPKFDLVLTYNTESAAAATLEALSPRALADPAFSALMVSIPVTRADNYLVLEFSSSEDLRRRSCRVLAAFALFADPVDVAMIDASRDG